MKWQVLEEALVDVVAETGVLGTASSSGDEDMTSKELTAEQRPSWRNCLCLWCHSSIQMFRKDSGEEM